MTRTLNREEIARLLPQQDPYFFLDSAVVEEEKVTAGFDVNGAAWILSGHFKNDPVMPASVGFEALGQAGCLWVFVNCPTGHNGGPVLFSLMDGARFFRKVRLGDRLEMELRVLRCRAPLVSFEGTIRVAGKTVAEVEKLSLTFGVEAPE